MSRAFLESLCRDSDGNYDDYRGYGRCGAFEHWLRSFKGEPRICWYPSAGGDLSDVELFWRDSALNACSWLKKDFACEPADIFIHSDYMPPFLSEYSEWMDIDRGAIENFSNMPYWLDDELVKLRNLEAERDQSENNLRLVERLVRELRALRQSAVLQQHLKIMRAYGALARPSDAQALEDLLPELRRQHEQIAKEYRRAEQRYRAEKKIMDYPGFSYGGSWGGRFRNLNDQCEIIEELPRLRLPLDGKIVSFPERKRDNGRVFFMQARGAPMLYVVGMNEALCAEVMLPMQAKLSHIVRVRYGNTLGGGISSGCFIYNMLERLGVELLVTDGYHNPMEGDERCYQLYPEMRGSYDLKKYRHVQSGMWSGFGVDMFDCSRLAAPQVAAVGLEP